VGDYTQLPSIHALIDRARGCLRREDLPYLVMSDPGSGAYVAAYTRVLAGGVPALLEEEGGRPLYECFDITENLLLSHSDASRGSRHRWFSILTASIELLGWDVWEGIRGMSPASSLRNLLTDSFALRSEGDARAPLELLPALCREMQAAGKNQHAHVAALLGELLVAALDGAKVEAKCRELHRCHDEFQRWGDEHGEPNPWYVERPDFIWAVVVGSRAELRSWLELVEAHFPSAPPLASATRERLLREGREWKRGPRRG
jgi:hypothetical protein